MRKSTIASIIFTLFLLGPSVGMASSKNFVLKYSGTFNEGYTRNIYFDEINNFSLLDVNNETTNSFRINLDGSNQTDPIESPFGNSGDYFSRYKISANGTRSAELINSNGTGYDYLIVLRSRLQKRTCEFKRKLNGFGTQVFRLTNNAKSLLFAEKNAWDFGHKATLYTMNDDGSCVASEPVYLGNLNDQESALVLAENQTSLIVKGDITKDSSNSDELLYWDFATGKVSFSDWSRSSYVHLQHSSDSTGLIVGGQLDYTISSLSDSSFGYIPLAPAAGSYESYLDVYNKLFNGVIPEIPESNKNILSFFSETSYPGKTLLAVQVDNSGSHYQDPKVKQIGHIGIFYRSKYNQKDDKVLMSLDIPTVPYENCTVKIDNPLSWRPESSFKQDGPVFVHEDSSTILIFYKLYASLSASLPEGANCSEMYRQFMVAYDFNGNKKFEIENSDVKAINGGEELLVTDYNKNEFCIVDTSSGVQRACTSKPFENRDSHLSENGKYLALFKKSNDNSSKLNVNIFEIQ